MRRAIAALLAMALAVAVVPAAPAAPAVKPPTANVVSAERDSQGTVWAVCSSESGRLFTFDGKEWVVRTFPPGIKERATPVKLARMPDGSVDCVWRLDNNRIAVTRQLGAELSLVAQGSGTIPGFGFRVGPFADSHNRLWMTQNGPDIYRTGPAQENWFAYHIAPEDQLKNTSKNWKPVAAVEDGRGRVWVWSDSGAGGTNLAGLRGVLIFDGDKAERRDISGITKDQFTVLARKDDRHMWLGLFRDGLYEVDIDTLQATPVPGPENQPFSMVVSVFSSGGDLYVINKKGSESALWRCRKGAWTRIVDPIEKGYPFEHCWAQADPGFVICGQPAPWYVGRDTPPIRLDWRTGFAGENFSKLIRLADGHWFGLAQGGIPFVQHIAWPPRQLPLGRVTPLDIRLGWIADAAGHLWLVPHDLQKPVLREWNGEKWADHPIPVNLDLIGIASLAADDAGRIWLLPDAGEYGAAYFDSRAQTWRRFSKIEPVFEELKTAPPRFTVPGRWYYIPQYSAQRDRIAFRTGKGEVAYFGGTAWRRWKRGEIAHGNQPDVPPGVPFFDASDRLCVNLGKSTWRFDGRDRWTQEGFEDRFPSDEFSGSYQKPPRPEPPAGCITQSPDSIAIDNLGVAWLTWKGALYKCRDGASVRVFDEGEPNPFLGSNRLGEVRVSAGGSAFLKTAGENPEYFQIAPKTPPPRTVLSVTSTGEDAVRIQFRAQPESKLQFHWQLDAEPWQWTAQREIALDALPNGAHTVRVQAFDAQLQSDEAPVAASFEIKIDRERQMKGLIAQLSHPDFARRKAAIAALSRQPAEALAALNAARPSANDDLRWWIDAAIQAIGQNRP